MTTEQMDATAEARRAGEPGMSEQFVDQLVERIGGHASARAVFGEAIERDDLTIVPVARVRWAFGAGSGSGGGDDASYGAGSGAGGGVSAEPLGHLEIRPSGATFHPIPQPYPSPIFLLASGITAALVLRALARILRG